MLCSQCGYTLPENANMCPQCGSAVPQNVGGSSPNTPSSTGYGPGSTVRASSNPVLPYQPTDPSASPQNVASPTASASVPPPPVAGATPLPLGTYSPVSSSPSLPPYLLSSSSTPAPGPLPFVSPPAQNNTGRTIALTTTIVLMTVGLVLLLLFSTGTIMTRQSANATITALKNQVTTVASDDATSLANNQASATAMAQATQDALSLTPTPYPPYTESHSPSGATFSGNAQHIILSAQLASEVNDQNQPTKLLSIFTPGQQFYLSYEWAQGNSGYVYLIYYFNGSVDFDSKSDYIDNKYGYGYFSATFNNIGQGAIEVYYCGQSDCGDKQLAWVRPFTVTDN